MSSVYVIEAENGFCKIGMSGDPVSRMSELQTGNPFKLSLRFFWKCRDRNYAGFLERRLHRLMSRHRKSGEWFKCTWVELQGPVTVLFGGLGSLGEFDFPEDVGGSLGVQG